MGLSPQSPGFDPRSFLLGLVAYERVRGQVFLRVIQASLHFNPTSAPYVFMYLPPTLYNF